MSPALDKFSSTSLFIFSSEYPNHPAAVVYAGKIVEFKSSKFEGKFVFFD